MRRFRCQPECRPCLERLMRQVVEASTDDANLQRRLLADGQVLLDIDFNPASIPSHIATRFLRYVKAKTGCQDPFETRKSEEMKHGRNAFRCLQGALEDAELAELFRLAALANSIDIFTSLDEIVKSSNGGFTWGVSHLDGLTDLFAQTEGPFLYLADNAGEVFFDAPLFRAVGSFFRESHYVVKGKPIQNDVTREDMGSVDMLDSFPSIITHGHDTVGLDITELDGDFLRLYDRAGFILAKGMGHYETLSHTESRGRILFLLKAKCKPVADSIGIEQGTYAAFIQ